jgi:hypothetical protein
MWKRLTHPNVLPLLGVAIDGFQLISEWMSGGHLLGYVQKNSDANRLGVVGIPPRCAYPSLIPVTSFPTSPKASATSIPAMSFMGTSRGYVVTLNLVPPLYSCITS